MSNRAHYRRAARAGAERPSSGPGLTPMDLVADNYLAETFRRAGPGGHAVTGICNSCGGLMFFAESAAGVEYVGSIIAGPMCEWHEDDPIGWAYNTAGVRWIDANS